MKNRCKIIINSPFPIDEKKVKWSLKNEPGWLYRDHCGFEFSDTKDGSIISIDITHTNLNDPELFEDIIREFERKFIRSTVHINLGKKKK